VQYVFFSASGAPNSRAAPGSPHSSYATDANIIIKGIFAKFKGCNVVDINCKCVKEALIHRTCRALQGISPPVLP